MSDLSADLYSIKAALQRLPDYCPYHRSDIGATGHLGPREGGQPRCESCRPAWRRMTGLAALERVSARLQPRVEFCSWCPTPTAPSVKFHRDGSRTHREHPIDRPRCSAAYFSNAVGVDIPCIREVGHGGDHRTDDASGAIEWPS